jgi:hypothetical protein
MNGTVGVGQCARDRMESSVELDTSTGLENGLSFVLACGDVVKDV